MSNNTKLKILCQRLAAQEFDSIHAAEMALEQFEKLTTPAMVLGLLTDEAGYRQGASVEARAADEARAEVRRLKLDNIEMREALTEKLIDATTLSGAIINTDGLTLGAEGGICKIMADAFGQMLFEGDVVNYIEAYFSSSKYPEMGQIVVTVKKETGKTPHELRLAAEQEGERLLNAVKFAAEAFGKITSSDGSGHADLGLAVLRIAGLPVTDRPAAATSSESAPCKIY
ncbi:hypothetical protein [Pseudomonas syringae]|uniref:Uncharacterized protein n=1 Tax=Pseudomonas syringae TaxID=317 RepID=A0A085V6N7_PSESX|nr:hypothetical protein [Pseudomonas syringae]KFE51100.1 hypothetical protein IV02_13900 [Pseudomonas syringae]